MTFQDMIMRLQSFWIERGCTLFHPYDMEVGAGTFHPWTFLASLGPEPAHACYVQPSRRPTDGRYGDNPNRLQHYFQFQVLRKPCEDSFLQDFFDSLSHLGIDLKKNDLKLVEDNWESPTLGAWGMGWEVWLNGMEITQITYFQQAGGQSCEPVSGELTYGLERIALHLQQCDHLFNIQWSPTLRYQDIFWQNEREQSHYNFELASTESLMHQFDACEHQCRALIKAQVPLPAYEQTIRASHTFNLLEARRALSIIERRRYIQRVRALACAVAQSYLEQRERFGYPRLKPSSQRTIKNNHAYSR